MKMITAKPYDACHPKLVFFKDQWHKIQRSKRSLMENGGLVI